MFHSFFNVSALIIESLLLLTFGMTLQRLKFPTNVSVHINSEKDLYLRSYLCQLHYYNDHIDKSYRFVLTLFFI